MIQGVVTEDEIRLSKANFVEIYSIKFCYMLELEIELRKML